MYINLEPVNIVRSKLVRVKRQNNFVKTSAVSQLMPVDTDNKKVTPSSYQVSLQLVVWNHLVASSHLTAFCTVFGETWINGTCQKETNLTMIRILLS